MLRMIVEAYRFTVVAFKVLFLFCSFFVVAVLALLEALGLIEAARTETIGGSDQEWVLHIAPSGRSISCEVPLEGAISRDEIELRMFDCVAVYAGTPEAEFYRGSAIDMEGN